MSGATRKRLAAVPDVAPDDEGHAPARPTSKPKPTTAAAAPGSAHGPYSKRPRSPALLPNDRKPMLAEVLQGVRLYAYDRHAIDWLCRWLDTPTFLSLLGILQRARLAEPPATPAPHARGGSQR